MSQFQNFEAGMPMSIPPKVDSFPLAVENLVKGRVCITNDAGFITIATVALSAKRDHFVNIAAVDNSGGSAGDLPVGVVGSGQRVTVQTKTILEPGDSVKVSATDGMVDLFVVGTDDNNLKIGTYIGIEPGVYSKDSADPFAEGYTTNAKPEVNAAVDDIVVIELR